MEDPHLSLKGWVSSPQAEQSQQKPCTRYYYYLPKTSWGAWWFRGGGRAEDEMWLMAGKRTRVAVPVREKSTQKIPPCSTVILSQISTGKSCWILQFLQHTQPCSALQEPNDVRAQGMWIMGVWGYDGILKKLCWPYRPYTHLPSQFTHIWVTNITYR